MKKSYSSANILLPDFEKTNANKWAAVACDQFTSQPDYWEKAFAIAEDAPSTLKIMLPEVYLSESKERIPVINETMKKYAKDVLVEHPDAMIYVERTQSDGTVRQGLMLAVDLECYDYKKGASSLIRATEATVADRIPPRVAIRRGACLELPHVMLLIDDPDHSVIEPLAKAELTNLAYDTPLMLGGGHIKGYFISDSEKERLGNALDALITPEAMSARYGSEGLSPLLFAVGDGNHSLASAKAAYEEIKAKIGEADAATHPARYALVEVVNIHSEALKFEPIYRVMFKVDPKDVLEALKNYLSNLSGSVEPQKINYVWSEASGVITAEHPDRQLTVATLQEFIDAYLSAHPEAEVDYIHGEAAVEELSKKQGAIGFMFEGMEKDQLFKTVIFDGALPRKTFSMGHAEDKRYYMECRKIDV